MRLKRLLEIPKRRLIKKILGFDEIYTIAVRKKGNEVFHCVPYSSKYWYADPLVYQYKNTDYLFVEAYDRTAGKGHIAVAAMKDDPGKIEFKPVIEEKYHMSFPMVFGWHQEIYMIPETSENFSINLYRAVEFPFKWERIESFKTKAKIVDTILLKTEDDRLYMLASEVNPSMPLEVRYQKFALQYSNGKWSLEWDDAFDSQQVYNLRDRNAGNCFMEESRVVLPTQVSTEIDYGVKLSFREWEDHGWKEKGQIEPADVVIQGIKRKNIIGIHTYARTEQQEIIDVRYQKLSPAMQWKKLRKR